MPRWPDVTTSSCASAGYASLPLSRVLPPSLEGCDVEAVRGWRHSVTKLTPALPHNSCIVLRMTAQGRLAE
jgi:hypothetical protein